VQRWLQHQVIGLLASDDGLAARVAPLQLLVRSIGAAIERERTRSKGAPFAMVGGPKTLCGRSVGPPGTDADDRCRTPQAVVVNPARDPCVCSL